MYRLIGQVVLKALNLQWLVSTKKYIFFTLYQVSLGSTNYTFKYIFKLRTDLARLKKRKI